MKFSIDSPLTASFKPSKGKSKKVGPKAKPAAAFSDTYTPSTPAERMKDAANDAKVQATRQWVAGDITTSQHLATHARADKIIKGRAGVKGEE